MKAGCATSAGLALIALIHDLGRPDRFHHMLRTFKVTSPMSVGSWLLSAYGPAAGIAALSDLTGIAPGIGAAATSAAAVTGPAVATYTAALISDTAVPAWHAGYRYLPFVFVCSAASAAAGLGLAGAPVAENQPAVRLAVLAGAAETLTQEVMKKRMGLPGEAYEQGRAKAYGRLAQTATVAGVLTTGLLGRRSRAAAAVAGAALLAGSALTRFSIFQAGFISAKDPKYTVVPQQERRSKSGVSRSV
jgi:formate-dependent nitrite reductase membrane component NrfD